MAAAAGAVLLAFAVGLPVPAAAETAELRLSTALGPAYPQGKAGEIWAALIAQRSGGRLGARHYPGAAAVGRDAAGEFGALRDGKVDLAVGSSLVWSAQVPALNLLALPWLIPDPDALDALLAGPVGRRLQDRIADAGPVPLALAGGSFVALATRSAVRKPADAAGLRIRLPQNALAFDTLAALGAAGQAMGAADARAALAAGTLDGEELAVTTYATARLDAAGLTHLLLWEAHAEAFVFAVNRARWESWDQADRDLVRDAALDAARQAAALARRTADAAALAALGARGVSITRLTASGKDAFRAAAQPAYRRWADVVGSELVEAAAAAVAATGTAPNR